MTKKGERTWRGKENETNTVMGKGIGRIDDEDNIRRRGKGKLEGE